MGKPIYIYDGSFEGFLTVVFEIYALKIKPLQIVSKWRWQPNFFDTSKLIETDYDKSERVWKGIISQSNNKVANMFYLTFASEIAGVEDEMYQYLEKMFADKTCTFYQNLLDESSYNLYKIARKVSHEVHRFTGFLRFQETADGMFFAVIDPDHDILNLLAPHFTGRFADRPWIIYDSKRDKGMYFDTDNLTEIRLSDKQFDEINGDLNSNVKAENEDFYRNLWKTYYNAINIPERKNTRLMTRLMPRRYWKYLPEKQ